MTQFLPPNLLALFAPREPLPFLPPPCKLPHEKKNVHTNYLGVAQFIAGNFEDPSETPPPVKVETREERLARKKREKEEQVAYKLEQEIALWDPSNPGENATADPFKTLFIGRINFYTSESKLRREFESYGPIKEIHMVTDQKSSKPRGYAFIEFEHERDMHTAYKKADGMKIDGRRVLVDVERSRTVKGWLPRRLGGGLGGTRRGGNEVNSRHSGREDGSSRNRSRSRDRNRSRSRERRRNKRSRSRSRERSKRSRRSRSRDRSKRSRSRGEKKRSRRSSRSRSPRGDRGSRRNRSRDRGSRRNRDEDSKSGGFRIKDEPDFGASGGGDDYYDRVQVKQETSVPPEEGERTERKPNLLALAQGYEQSDFNDGY